MPTLKDLLGKQADIVGTLWEGFGNNPRNQETVDAMKGMLGLLPLGAGDVASGLLAADDFRRGDTLSGLLNGAGVLPYVPALGGMIKSKYGFIPENIDDLKSLEGKSWFSPIAGEMKKYSSSSADAMASNLFGYQGIKDYDSLTKKQKLIVNNELSRIYRVSEKEQKSKYISSLVNALDDNLKSIHKNQDLQFTSIPVNTFNNSGKTIYKSKAYNRNQSSEYKVLLGNDGVPAFARKSNHWGRFSTNLYATPEQMASGEISDIYGRVGYKPYNWELDGGNVSLRNSQAGAISLKNLGDILFNTK